MLVWTNWRTDIVLPRRWSFRGIGRPTRERTETAMSRFCRPRADGTARRGQARLFRVQFIIFPSERRRKLASLLFCRSTAKFRPRIVSTRPYRGYRASHKSADRNACSREARRRWWALAFFARKFGTRHAAMSVNCILENTFCRWLGNYFVSCSYWEISYVQWKYIIFFA